MSTPPNSAAKHSLCHATHKTAPCTVVCRAENGKVVV